MPLRFTHRILDHLAHVKYRPAAVTDIACDLRVPPEDEAVLQQSIQQLAEQGRIVIDRDGLVRLPGFGEEVIGAFRLNARGFGFVIPDHPLREGDLFIPRGKTRDAISGDRVRAKVIDRKLHRSASPGRSPFVGCIEEVRYF